MNEEERVEAALTKFWVEFARSGCEEQKTKAAGGRLKVL